MARQHPSPHTKPEKTPPAVGSHPMRNTQPYLSHETLTQDQQAKFLGVTQETTCNLGHKVPVSEIMNNPVRNDVDYTSGKAGKGFMTESDHPGHGVYGSFKDSRSGLSTDFESLANWQTFASANSYNSRNGGCTPQDPHPDKRALFPGGRDSTGTGGGHKP